MKVLTTADWHLGSFRGPEREGINLRSEDTLRCLDELVRVAKEEKPEMILVSGDIFDRAEIGQGRSHKEVLQARKIIMELSAIAEHVIVMRGTPNHDSAGAFEELKAHFEFIDNVWIVTTPMVIRTTKFDIAVLPGFDRGVFRAKHPGLSKEKENEVITEELSNIVLGLKSEINPEKASIFMAHDTVPGCNMESGQTMMLTQFEPVIPQEVLLAAGYDLVALGHIHRPQRVTKNPWYYSGAINAMNFNDEGQERGFWIHHFEDGALGLDRMVLTDSQFFRTPIREFVTLSFTDSDITAVNLGHIDEVAFNYWRFNGAVQDKIVRVLYSCSAENGKALNKALLEKTLLDDGAFMVSEILPDSIEETANRAELARTTDPEENLIRYLEEKHFSPEDVQALVLKARPVIVKAEESMTMTANTGMFEPVEISVINYRNYEEETFSFNDISFCTINGQNGAGKSSLFMDAIIDCLYEEPREGELSGWVRNDDGGCSGSIMFTFRIGDKTYRVTRTRSRPKKGTKTKTGKGTLNLSELVGGEWENRSKERLDDTQQEILNIVGMDSFTFKSCALIMQDQYGLFLQAKPEERVEVLGNLLGLGIYQVMERIASDKAKVYGAKNRELKQEVEIHNNTISGYGNPDEELAACQTELSEYENSLREKTEERDKKKLLLANQQEAAERRVKLLSSIAALQNKKTATEQNRAAQQAIADSSAVILDDREEIEEKIAEYKALLERELELAGESALYSSKKQEAENFARQAVTEKEAIDAYKESVKQKEAEILTLQPTDQDIVIRGNATEYHRQKKLLDEAYEKERSYRAAEQKLTQEKHNLQQISSQYDAVVQRMQLAEESLKKKAELLSNVKCVDISNAKCGFLVDAVSAKQALETYPEKYAEKEKDYQEQAAPINQKISELEKKISDMDFNAGAVAEISGKVSELKPYVSQLEIINQREGRIALLKADIKHLKSNILEAEKRLFKAESGGIVAEKERNLYADAFSKHVKVQSEIAALEPWLEKEKQLPVAEERNATALNRVMELTADLMTIDTEIAQKQAEADKEVSAMTGMEELAGIVAKMNADVEVFHSLVKEKQMKIGALQQKSEQIARLKQEISVLQKQQTEYAKETADYEALKAAFSQNGVPHQIIRSIIPQLTDTSNAILGQMTGGKMGIEFHLERLQKNGKEKASLDIFIEEYGKTALPYLSKSGGEKVKSSLAVILALAEIKSLSAGIQLGFLQIDEPPFLDSDGTQAYVDALEAIQQRYPDLKVMAITHDQEFKARFPQSITVYKDEHGSHVRLD